MDARSEQLKAELFDKLSDPDVTVEDGGSVDNETRRGKYITLKKGMYYKCLFVGDDLENDEFIIEDTGQ